ncbi:MAG: hypothetical protein MI974_16595 [Chitinophagales bacterium]|nr:hypothetical protein [Chitinophagales bacterium]
MKIHALVLLCILALSSCSYVESNTAEELQESEPNVQVNTYPGVDEALWPYFTRFEEEAALRGIDIDLVGEDITGVIEDLPEENVAGQCSYNSHNPNHVTIDEEFWANASDRYREYVIFHELGHCHLLRDHREAANPDGTCKSIMRSGLGDCSDNYHQLTRATYLDELFDPQFKNSLIGG